ncbi:MAG TPA: type IV pilus assembly protein PilM [Chthoniobacterales bacterium]|jgi:type IV pilus assembly protein PilM
MAAATRIISLNLGSQTVSVAVFHTLPHGGLVLHEHRLRDVLADVAAEGMRSAHVAAALREMLAEMQIGFGEVNYAVPGQSVFARFVKLPAVEEEKIERIIAFEAQQNVPFPINEVVWDYQLVGGGADEQIQVVLVAIKSDLLDEMNAAVEGTGLRTSIVDVAPMSLYNAFRYNYGDLQDCSLLVDIGARTTNLLFIEPGKVFSRSVPIGGSSITSAIAREFDEPFAAAELRKKRDGFVSLGGAYAEASDPDVARVSKIVRSTMTRLHAELMRSISHYRAQQQGAAPERVYLCGASASTPYMREFFQEKLQVPIEFFNPLRNVSVSPSAPVAEISRSAHLLGELVGLALRAATACPMELNLRPAAVVRRHELEKRRPHFVLAAACFILALLGWGIYYTRAAHITRRATDRLQEKIDVMHAAETQLDKLKKQVASIDSLASPLIDAVNDRGFWLEVLEDLNTRLPKEDIWITELLPTSGGKPVGVDEKRIAEFSAGATPTPPAAPARPNAARPGAPAIDGIFVRGLYLFNPKQQEVVVDYFRNLIGSSYFAIDPNNQARVIKPSTPNNTDWAFPYELHLDLKKPMKLP